MSAVLAIKKGQGPEKCLEQLNSCIEIHFKGLKVRQQFVLPIIISFISL